MDLKGIPEITLLFMYDFAAIRIISCISNSCSLPPLLKTTSGNTKAGFAPVAIGFTLGFLCLIGGTVSGGAFNPARAFGPTLVSGSGWGYHWIYWVGDFLGAGLAGYAQSFFAHEAHVHEVKTNKAKAH